MNKENKLTEEQIQRGREFMKDLRANLLKATNIMRDENGARCCLCVAYDTAQRLGADLPEHDGLAPPREICDFYGWVNSNPFLEEHPAAVHNDGTNSVVEKSHKEIADLFELKYPELKP